MQIAFRFDYIHSNELFTRLLNRIAALSDIPVNLYQEGIHYSVEAQGSQAELEALADLISGLVPHSLFLRNYKIEEVKREDVENLQTTPSLGLKQTAFQTPYCPECQKKVTRTLNPFVTCSVCGMSEAPSLSMETLGVATGIHAETHQAFFSQLATQLSEKGELILPTYNGVRRFSLLNENVRNPEGILCCNPSTISDHFLITQGELDALMMVEKPTLRLKAKLMLRATYDLAEPFYPVFLPDDTVTLSLSVALKEKGIDIVFCDHVSTLRVVSALNDNLIVTPGRDMLPYKVPFSLKNASFCHFGGFMAYGDRDGMEVGKQIEPRCTPFIAYAAHHETSAFAKAIRFEPAHAALRSVVIEQNLVGLSLCGIYLSRENPSHIFSFSKKIGYTPMALFNTAFLSQPKEMLEAIAAMDDGGRRLVANFKNTFPKLHETIEKLRFKSGSHISDIAKLWSIASVFIGLYDSDNAQKACEMLEATAIEFGGKSGPRIDYKIISTQEGYQLDFRLAIRSAMSFKLAGLDDYLLSFGFIDSLADFIAQQSEDSDANVGINGVVIAGDLFENRQLLMRTYNALSVNYPIYKNERLSIDNANVSFGAISLGNE